MPSSNTLVGELDTLMGVPDAQVCPIINVHFFGHVGKIECGSEGRSILNNFLIYIQKLNQNSNYLTKIAVVVQFFRLGRRA